MGWVTGIVVYLLVWWVTLFAVLPLWVTPADPDDPGTPDVLLRTVAIPDDRLQPDPDQRV